MISPAASDLEPETLPRGDRWRQAWLVILAATLVLLIVVAVGQIPSDAESVRAGSPAAAGAIAGAGRSADPGLLAGSASASLPGSPAVSPSVRSDISGAPGAGVSGADQPAGGEPGAPGTGSAGSGTAGSGTAGSDSDGSGAAGSGTTGSGAVGSGGAPGPGNAEAGGTPPLESGDVAQLFPPANVLQLPGATPSRGSGRFDYATGRGAVAGSRGPVRRYRVAVERGSNEDVRGFAAQVDSILSDARSWSGNGRERLQMVGGSERADFTVFLATRETAGRMCLRGGTNIRIGGVPYTSCRATGKAIINLDRWRGSARPFVQHRTSLATYRQYVINHEVGHELGHRHEGCPKAGGPAPVMVQQTITLRGCKPYAWPRRNDRGFSGPRL